MINLVFSSIELNYAFTVIKTINKDDYDVKDFKISDRVQDTDLKIKEKRFFDGIISKFNSIKNLSPDDEKLKLEEKIKSANELRRLVSTVMKTPSNEFDNAFEVLKRFLIAQDGFIKKLSIR